MESLQLTMKYSLQLSRKAAQDRDLDYAWFERNHSKKFADRWYAGLSRAVKAIQSSPLSSPLSVDIDEEGLEVREYLYDYSGQYKYRILYSIAEKQIHILRIWHSARGTPDWESK